MWATPGFRQAVVPAPITLTAHLNPKLVFDFQNTNKHPPYRLGLGFHPPPETNFRVPAAKKHHLPQLQTSKPNGESTSLQEEGADKGNDLGWLPAFPHVLVASMSNFLFGYHIGVMNGPIVSIARELGFEGNSFIEGLVVSIFIAGAFIGSIISGSLVDKLGCRRTVQVDTIPLILGAIISGQAHSLDEILWGRFLVGLGIGVNTVLVPIYISEVGRLEDAKEVIRNLWGPSEVNKAIEEFQSVNRNDDLESRWLELLEQPHTRVAFIGGALFILQQFAGINGVLYFSSLTFQDVGITSGALASLFVGLTNFAGTLGALYLMDKQGRKRLMIGSYLGMAISMFLVVYAISSPMDEELGHNLSILGTVLYIFTFAIGAGPVTGLIIPELSSSRMRGKIMGFSFSVHWVCNFLVGLFFLELVEKFGVAPVYASFGAVSLLSAIFAYNFIVETKGRSLEEIEMSLNPNFAAKDEIKKSHPRSEPMWAAPGFRQAFVPVPITLTAPDNKHPPYRLGLGFHPPPQTKFRVPAAKKHHLPQLQTSKPSLEEEGESTSLQEEEGADKGIDVGWLPAFPHVLVASMSEFLFGYHIGVMNGPIVSIARELGFEGNSFIEGLVVSIFIAGAFIGSISSGSLVDKLGCRRTVQVDTIPLILVDKLIPWMKYSGEDFLLALALAVNSAIVPIYISEVAPTKYRGSLGTLCQIGTCLGIIASLILGSGGQFSILRVSLDLFYSLVGRLEDAKEVIRNLWGPSEVNKAIEEFQSVNRNDDLESRWLELLEQPHSRGCIKAISMFLVVYAISSPIDEELGHNLSILGTVLYIFTFAIGSGPVTGIIIPELSSSRMRGKIMGFSFSVHWVCNFLVGLFFLELVEKFGVAPVYASFGAFSLLSAIFAYNFIIETKGRSLEEIEMSLNPNFAAKDE
ncbi:hypothetical protein HYC85_011937 [Camellia sinensis]|uniref:Major facilitator superfamily (MFS) profile domain-containing protein n=1 Tax=Camellia sinensis TaxID=4442 RepID=A0A7J7HDE3_CAMSI|nr:hypothetical protein HYC85_011937 [Camellia sinensis]